MKREHHHYWHPIRIGLLCILFYSLCVPQIFAETAAETAQPLSLSQLKSGQVLLSWEELKRLLEETERLKQHIEKLKAEQAKKIEKLKAEQAKKEEALKETLPIEYTLTQSHLTGKVKGLSAQFKAEFSVQILKKGWLKIPFFQNEVGIEAVSITVPDTSETASIANQAQPNGKPLAQFVRNAQGYDLLAKGPQSFAIQVTFRAPIQVNELTYTLSFQPPRAVINQISLQIPEKGVNVIQKTAHSQVIQENDLTTIESVLSERESLKLSWQVEKDSSLNRKSRAVLHTLASVDKSEITLFSTLVLKHIASLNEIAFRLPLNVEIINVTSLDIEQWSIEKLKDAQLIKLAGQTDPRTAINIDLSYRLRLASLPTDIAIPTVDVIGTDSFEGFMGLEALGNLEVHAKPLKNGVQIPAKNLPKRLWQKAANPLLYGYQFYGKAFSPSLSIKGYQDIQTVVANVDLVDCVTHRTLDGKSITRIQYFIRNNDRQFLTLTLPKNSRLWQAFLNGKPVKPAQKDTGEILIPMKKSTSQGGELESFALEIGYVTEVSKLSLKGDILNQLPAIDIPISYLKWTLYLPEYYEYSRFEGLLKQVSQFSKGATKPRFSKAQLERQLKLVTLLLKQAETNPHLSKAEIESLLKEVTKFSNVATKPHLSKAQIDIPTQGRRFLFEKYLIVDGRPYIRGKYGQFLGNDIFLSLHGNRQFRSRPKRMNRRSSQSKADVAKRSEPMSMNRIPSQSKVDVAGEEAASSQPYDKMPESATQVAPNMSF